MLSVFLINVAFFIAKLSVIMMNVVMLCVLAPTFDIKFENNSKKHIFYMRTFWTNGIKFFAVFKLFCRDWVADLGAFWVPRHSG